MLKQKYGLRFIFLLLFMVAFLLNFDCVDVFAADNIDTATDGDASYDSLEDYTEEYSEIIPDELEPVVMGAANASAIYDGVDYSAVYDYNYYITKYPDIKATFGDNTEAALQHFVNCGMNEGRQAKESFNVYSYAYKYADLRSAFGNNLKSYYQHYITNGVREGRVAVGTNKLQNPVTVYEGVDYSPVYNYNYYISHNKDIKNAFGIDDYSALQHFVNSGMNEGRQACEDFNVYSYANKYADLRGAFGNDKKLYYIHYITNGAKEGRVATGTNQIQNPVTIYNGVDYSKVYDFYYYINHNSEVKSAYSLDDYGALEHFVNTGMDKGLQAKEDFDVWSYGYSYSDLRRAFGNQPKSYYMHYITNGSKEGRNLTHGVTSSNNELTVYAGYDFSDIYDIVYYTSHNIDVRNAFGFDEEAVLAHFARNGLKENRVAAASYSSAKYADAKEQMAEHFKTTNKTDKYPKAVNVLNNVGWNLNSAFNWAAELKYYSGVSKTPDPGINYFGNFGFDNGKGNCYVLAAVFYEMAYVMGYDVRQMAGTVPLRAGGQGPHSWVEIDMDGETYVFDPDFTNETKYNGFKFKYGQSGTWIYNNISQMHE
ncbi:MAG: transglutaminase domain-containing protein [Lachnospiraceae bacterium]|nr:transglutaminase domain-containing protein [Lachnospiraceae bacterium]